MASDRRTVNGVEIVLVNGVVFSCSDWSQVVLWAIAKQHGFSTRSYGPGTYGHTSVLYNG